jgi:glycosyltransferase involved in cell wall biosynthesis
MENNPLVSVIIPCFQCAPYLRDTVNSILHSSYSPLEIILVDDGSTDGSASLLDALAKENPAVHAYHLPHGGPTKARNLGLSEAKGKYLSFIDSDDTISPDMYSSLAALLEANPSYPAAIGNIVDIAKGKKPRPEKDLMPEGFIPSETYVNLLLLFKGQSSVCPGLFRKEVFTKTRFTDEANGEDFVFWINLLPQIEGVYHLKKDCYYYLQHSDSYSHRAVFDSSFKIKNVLDTASAVVSRHYPKLALSLDYFYFRHLYSAIVLLPLKDIRKDNPFYSQLKAYLEAHVQDISKNPYLTPKQKKILRHFNYAPRFTRRAIWIARFFKYGKGF